MPPAAFTIRSIPLSDQPVLNGAHDAAEAAPQLQASPLPVTEGVAPEASGSALSTEKVYQKLDPRSVTVDQISSVIFAICVLGCVIIGMGIWLLTDWPPRVVYWISVGGAALACVFLFWLSFALPVVDYRKRMWRLDESGLEIRSGIFWRREITIPRARVQHTDVRQGPLQRQYGVAKLVIHTAGTEAASIELNGLSLPIAQWLRDELIGELKGKNDAV